MFQTMIVVLVSTYKEIFVGDKWLSLNVQGSLFGSFIYTAFLRSPCRKTVVLHPFGREVMIVRSDNNKNDSYHCYFRNLSKGLILDAIFLSISKSN